MDTHDLVKARDDDAWHDAAVVPAEVGWRRHGGEAWLPGHPSPWDTAHEPAMWFATTRIGFTPCGTLADLAESALLEHVPMGYTALTVYEKRAVFAGGRLGRLWSWPSWSHGYRVLTVGADGCPLEGSEHGVLWHALADARRWSELLGDRPVVVARRRLTRDWH